MFGVSRIRHPRPYWACPDPASAHKHACAWRRARRALPYYAGLASVVTSARYPAGPVLLDATPFLPFPFLSLSPFEDILPLEHVSTYALRIQAFNTRGLTRWRAGCVYQRLPTVSGGAQFNVIPGIFRYSPAKTETGKR